MILLNRTAVSQHATQNYNFGGNDPFDRSTPIRMVVDRLLESQTYMKSIRAFQVPQDGLAIWFFGQNGFIIKAAQGPVIGIDLYLTDSCAETFSELPFRLNRQLPVFVEPEDLDADVFLTTHSHHDHADPGTIRRFAKKADAIFRGPYQSIQRYKECGVSEGLCRLLHSGQELELSGPTKIRGTFALPTDRTDLNHTGVLLEFANGIMFLQYRRYRVL
jgi:L-ascorbate 6-phosphate lactonase